MNIDSCYKIGLVLKPHGLKGEVTISIDADIPNDFATLDAVFLANQERLVPYFIQHASVRGAKAFVKFEDVDSPEEAARISKQAIYLPKTARPKSTRGEFYDDEVINFEVIDDTLGTLGEVTEVMQAGANRLLVLMHQNKEVLIPINSPFITSVNKSKKRISVNLPEGFLDI
ncbi:MAG TPA: ribosome maturation factor RimM [Ohtaekwangia sp.]|uniref:ribosome maturation factor RimM n=1 Tax=Ohtaekwangia sp. TaxID=2066019 RepID=UPI002F951185